MLNKQIFFTGVHRAELLENEVDRVKGNEVLVKMEYTVVSGGTERACIMGLNNTPQNFPMSLGYCGVGYVEEIGHDVKKVALGDRVLVYHGCHSKYNMCTEDQLTKVENDSVSSLEAAFVIIASMGLGGVRKLEIELGESAMVMGQGLLGVFATQFLRLSGANPVIAVDLNSARRELALNLGADYAFDPSDKDFVQKVKEVTKGKGVNGCVEVTGIAKAMNQAHEHFQGGNHIFAMQKAESERFYKIAGFEDVEVSTLKWPMSVIRLKSEDADKIVELSDRILTSWRNYTDEDAFIFAETNGEKHNTITPIASMSDGKYVMDLVLRNNITTKEHPLGVYHPHAEHHHIKKENIGLIEVMGLAVLPSRLVEELDAVADAIINGLNMSENEKTSAHKEWAEEVVKNHPEINSSNVDEILKEEVGKVFINVLEHAGVYKRDEQGRKAFDKFMNQI